MQQWKKVVFENNGPLGLKRNETSLSIAMPDRPGDYAGWLNGIDKLPLTNRWMRKSGNLKKDLIQNVVGEDKEKLIQLWNGVAESENPEKMAKDVYKHLTEEQKKILNDPLQNTGLTDDAKKAFDAAKKEAKQKPAFGAGASGNDEEEEKKKKEEEQEEAKTGPKPPGPG